MSCGGLSGLSSFFCLLFTFFRCFLWLFGRVFGCSFSLFLQTRLLFLVFFDICIGCLDLLLHLKDLFHDFGLMLLIRLFFFG